MMCEIIGADNVDFILKKCINISITKTNMAEHDETSTIDTQLLNKTLKRIAELRKSGEDLSSLDDNQKTLFSFCEKAYNRKLAKMKKSKSLSESETKELEAWSSMDVYAKAELVLQEQKTMRVSPEDVVGTTIPISRVKKFLNSSLNQEYDNLLKLIYQCESNGESLDTLTDADALRIQDCVDDFEPSTKRMNKETGKDVELEFYVPSEKEGVKTKKKWSEMTEHQQAAEAVRNSKCRIAVNALIALSSIVDSLAHELSHHAIKNTVKNNMTNVHKKYMMEGIESLSLYPLIANLPSFVQFRQDVDFEALFEETYERELANLKSLKKTISDNEFKLQKMQLRNQIRQTLSEEYNYTPSDDKNDDAEESDDLDESLIIEPQHKRVSNFVFYVASIAKMHIDTSHTNQNRISHVFKKFVSKLLVEFIKGPMADGLRMLLEEKNAKTVVSKQVIRTTKYILQLFNVHDFKVLELAQRRCDMWHRYSTDKANSKKDVENGKKVDFNPKKYLFDKTTTQHDTVPRPPAKKQKAKQEYSKKKAKGDAKKKAKASGEARNGTSKHHAHHPEAASA